MDDVLGTHTVGAVVLQAVTPRVLPQSVLWMSLKASLTSGTPGGYLGDEDSEQGKQYPEISPDASLDKLVPIAVTVSLGNL